MPHDLNDPQFYELKEAWLVAREKYAKESYNGYKMSKQLARLLGIPYKTNGAYEELPYSMIPLLKAIVGPHGHAVLKAYRIQKGLEP